MTGESGAARKAAGETGLVHRARVFAALPGPAAASDLLGELADAPCAFAPVSMNRPLALYGAGNLGRLARDFLKAVGHDFVMAVDRNADRLAADPAWAGVRLLHPDAVSATYRREVRLAVSVVTAPYVPLEAALRAQGFDDIVPFYDLAENFRHLHPLSNGWFAAPMTAGDRAKTAEVLRGWGDDVSRAHHLQFLAWRRLREEWTFAPAPVLDGGRYFIPEVTEALRGDEIFVDAGAHHGSVAETFLDAVGGSCEAIVAVEPDAANRAVLTETLQARLPDDPRVVIHDCALAEAEGEAPFHDGLGYASQIAATGKTQVATRPLDALELAPSFIKLHLEGGELSALRGARRTLRASRPLVAATVYHNDDGIWRTPHWLMQALPDYRFLFRNHSWCGTGAVVYGIPVERLPR